MKSEIISKMVKDQREFFFSGETKDIKTRIDNLKKLKKAINDFEPDIIHALKKDLGKPETDAYISEVHEVIREIDYSVKKIKSWSSVKRVPTPITLLPASSHIKPEPLGVVLVIGPWNYPFMLSLAPVVSSIAAGNTTIIKPSEIASNTEAVIKQMIKERFDPEFISVITGGVPETTLLLKEKFDHIFFTGGGEIGKIVMKSAAEHLTPVTLELGGKSPCIVDDDIDIKVASKRIVWGKFFNTGQTCVAPDYLLVKENIKKDLLLEMKKTITEFFGPDPKLSSQYGRIISKRHIERLKAFLDCGNIYTGGNINIEERYFSPTILTDVDEKSSVMQEEIFGPILPVITYKNISEAIDFVNLRPKPLALYAFSKNKTFTDRILNETSSGGVCINDVIIHISTNHLPFGGVGESGMGSYHGKAGFDRLSHSKSILKKPFLLDMFLRYAPYHKLFSRIMRFI